jgi:hypothetical protein
MVLAPLLRDLGRFFEGAPLQIAKSDSHRLDHVPLTPVQAASAVATNKPLLPLASKPSSFRNADGRPARGRPCHVFNAPVEFGTE